MQLNFKNLTVEGHSLGIGLEHHEHERDAKEVFPDTVLTKDRMTFAVPLKD